MGMGTEFNWYLVIESKEEVSDVEEYNALKVVKSGNRIYPTGGLVPLIVKNKGCVGIVRVIQTTNSTNRTIVYFRAVENLEIESEISQHYYGLYLKMKSEGEAKPEIKSFKNSVLNRGNENEKA